YLSYLRDQQEAMVEELGRYVCIESGSREKAGVDQVGREVSKAFAALGFTIERIESATCGDHLVARRTGNGRGRLLALIHLDTTWPSGSLAENPFRVEAGRAYGPGIRDMKGGWVVLLGALRALRHAGWDGLAQTTVFLTGDEELGSVSGRPWIEHEGRQADWVVVMEPARADGNLVTSRGMVGAVSFEVRGQAVHNTERSRGSSAIAEAAHQILALEALNDVERGVLVSVGLIDGGTARQILPDRAHLSIDLRAPDTRAAEELVERVRAIAAQPTVPGTSTSMSGGITRPAMETSAGSQRMLRLAQQVGRELGLSLDATHTRSGSDGSFTGAMGVPTLDGLGPESAGGAGRSENVLVASLPRRAALLAGIIRGLPDLLDQD
ncbi:MAG TPA: M20 family metallopeptidase, partial [Thermomicrobiaceae bacterium]|nr:M20 family metallopeptidase [Thermomicrobiaceae bacterium]